MRIENLESIGNCKAGFICIADDSEPFKLQTNRLSGKKPAAWWHGPRTGNATRSGTFAKPKMRKFAPPSSGIGNDLVLDDVARKFRSRP